MKKLLTILITTLCIISSQAQQDCMPYQWTNKVGGTSNDYGYSVSTDISGNVFVTGAFSGTVSFGTVTFTSAGNTDVFIAKLDANGNFLWAKQAGGMSNDYAYSVSTDASGNAYITGQFYGGTAAFGATTLTSSSVGFDIFIAKLDVNGNFLWAEQTGGTVVDDSGYSVSTDASGNAYITGFFQGTATFGTATLTSAGSADIFIAKLDANGNFLWAKQAGGTNGEYGYSVSTDASGNAYIAGYFFGTAAFGTTTLTPAGSADIFIAKLDANGNFLWAKQAGGMGNDYGYSVSTDTSGNAYIAGAFNGMASFGTTTFTSAGSDDIFIAKLDTNGNLLWVKQAGGTNSDFGSSVSTDASGNAYITGAFSGTASFGTATLVSAGNADIFIVKLDANGNFLLAKQAGGTNSEFGRSVSADASGNVYITGWYSGMASFGTNTLTSAGSNDIFIVKLISNISPSISVNSGSVCVGSSFTITPNGANTYTITGGNFTVSPNSTTSYSVTGTSTAGCVSASAAVAAVTVYSLPVVAATSGSICNGGVYTSTVSGANTYSVNGISASTFTFNPSSSTNYNITGSSTQGCVAGNTVAAAVTVYSLPMVSLNSGSICAGGNFTITPSGATTYTITGGNFTVSPSTQTSYSVIGKSAQGCASSNTAVSTVSVKATPSTSVTVSSNTICVNETGTLSASGADTYTWSTNENGSSISVSPSITTTYSVAGTNTNACTSAASATLFVDECLGIGKLEMQHDKLKIYPNPVSSVLSVEFVSSSEVENLTIYDVLGKEILNEKLNIKHGAAQINVSEISKGIYFIKVGNETRKFVKE